MKRKRLEKKYNSRCELIGRKKGLFFFFFDNKGEEKFK